MDLSLRTSSTMPQNLLWSSPASTNILADWALKEEGTLPAIPLRTDTTASTSTPCESSMYSERLAETASLNSMSPPTRARI